LGSGLAVNQQDWQHASCQERTVAVNRCSCRGSLSALCRHFAVHGEQARRIAQAARLIPPAIGKEDIMKRDKALMGEILKQLASFGTLYGDVEKIQSALPGQVAPEVILHHLRLLYDRGLAAVDMHNFWRVTDQGYDALEAGGELFGKQEAPLPGQRGIDN
jgi:hypothetical protein